MKPITIQLTEADVLAGQRLHGTRARVLTWGLPLLILAGYGIESATSSGPNAFFQQMMPVSVALLLFLPINHYVLLPFLSQRGLRQSKPPQRTHTVSWDDECFHYVSDVTNAKTPWTDFRRWRGNPLVTMLYLSERSFYAVPARAFDGQQEVTEEGFRRLLTEKIGPMGKPSPHAV